MDMNKFLQSKLERNHRDINSMPVVIFIKRFNLGPNCSFLDRYQYMININPLEREGFKAKNICCGHMEP